MVVRLNKCRGDSLEHVVNLFALWANRWLFKFAPDEFVRRQKKVSKEKATRMPLESLRTSLCRALRVLRVQIGYPAALSYAPKLSTRVDRRAVPGPLPTSGLLPLPHGLITQHILVLRLSGARQTGATPPEFRWQSENLVTTRAPSVSIARQGYLNSDERIISLVSHGLQIAGYSTIGMRIVFSPEAAGDLLFDFNCFSGRLETLIQVSCNKRFNCFAQR